MNTRIPENRKIPANGQLRYLLLLLGFMLAAWPVEASAQRAWRMLLNTETFSVAVNPLNPRTLYAGGNARKVYRSYDAGRTWDTLAVGFIDGNGWFSNVFVHPVDTNVVLVGGSQLGTVQRSTDNGVTWTKVLDPSPNNIALNGEVIIAKPDNTDTMYLGGLNPADIYRSSNRGVTWDSISTIEDVPFLCTLTIRTDSTNVIFAGCADGIIHKSTDGGRTWYKTVMIKNIEDPFQSLEIPKIVMSKSNPMLGYATVTCFSPYSLPNGGLYRTTDGGETWKHFAFADTSMWSLALGGVNDEYIFIGGFSAHELIRGAGIVREIGSTGSLWLDLDNTIPWQPGNHGGIQNMWMMKVSGPAAIPIVYMATEAGLFVYDDYAVSVPETSSSYGVALSLSPDGTATAVLPDWCTEPFTLRCFDMLGNSVGTFSAVGPGRHQFALQQLSTGRYYLQVIYKGSIIGSVLSSYSR